MSLKDANKALLGGRFAIASLTYWNHKIALGPGSPSLDYNLEVLRRRWLRSREGQRLKVVVTAWELSHNPAGRAMTLAEVWRPYADVEIVGCCIPSFGRALWPPLQASPIACHSFVSAQPTTLYPS